MRHPIQLAFAEFESVEGHADFLFDEFFGFGNEVEHVIAVYIADYYQVYKGRFFAFGPIVGYKDLFDFAEFVEYLFYEGVDAYLFHNDAAEVIEQRVLDIGAVLLLIGIGVGNGFDEFHVAELVELGTHGVGTYTKLLFKSAQVYRIAGVKQKFGKELDAYFALEESLYQSLELRDESLEGRV